MKQSAGFFKKILFKMVKKGWNERTISPTQMYNKWYVPGNWALNRYLSAARFNFSVHEKKLLSEYY